MESDNIPTIIESLSQFTNFVEELPKEYTLSRGQRKEYELLPGALRLDEKNNRKFSRSDIQYFLDEFKINSHNYMKFPSNVHEDYEWMVYAQHYGIPTRLLDFTHSHVVSLMFAVEDAFINGEDNDAEVWFLNPKGLNGKYSNRTEIINVLDRGTVNLDSCDGPVVIKARKLNERINAQNGLFVYFQDTSSSLNKIVDDTILKRAIIGGEFKREIISSLYSMGIGITTLYPELSSVSKDIIMKKNILDYLKEGE